MRVLPAAFGLLAGLALVVLAVPASAQDPDGSPGCAQDNPCEVIVEVDAQGISDLSYDRFGTGDWILLSIFNGDEQAHTLSLEGHAFEATVEDGDLVDTQPFKLGAPGVYELRDQPSGDTAAITVEDEEVFDVGSDSGSSTKGTNPLPGPAPLVVVGLLAAVAGALRRK